VVNESVRALARLAGVADSTVSLDTGDSAGLFGGERLPPWLAGGPVVYSWLGAGDAGVRERVTRAAKVARFFRVERGAGSMHAAAAYSRAVGGPADPLRLAAAATILPPLSPRADRLWRELTAPVLAIHPGAGARAKRWDVAGFVQVAHWWRSAGGAVLAVAGPAEGDEAPVLGPHEVRDWPLPDLAAVLARAALYLGNDSGVSHLAGAVGAAGVVLFGPTEARRWRPAAGRLVPVGARFSGPDGMGLSALPAARVVAACRRRFALTRGTLNTSVGAYSATGRLRRILK
jgi:glycosyl transferase family 9 (putative heptosyltransferase)